MVLSRGFVQIMLAVLVGFSTVLGLGAVHQLRTGYDRPTEVAIDWEATSPAVWYALREQGWTGRHGDGVERLYVPVGARVEVDGLTFEVTETGIHEVNSANEYWPVVRPVSTTS